MRGALWIITWGLGLLFSYSTTTAAPSTTDALKEAQFLIDAGWTVKAKARIEQALADETLFSPLELADWLELPARIALVDPLSLTRSNLREIEQHLIRAQDLRKKNAFDNRRLIRNKALHIYLIRFLVDDQTAYHQAEQLLAQTEEEQGDAIAQAICLLLRIMHRETDYRRYESAQELVNRATLLLEPLGVEAQALLLIIRHRAITLSTSRKEETRKIIPIIVQESERLLGANSPVTLWRKDIAAYYSEWMAGNYQDALSSYQDIFSHTTVLCENLPARCLQFLLHYGIAQREIGEVDQALRVLEQTVTDSAGLDTWRMSSYRILMITQLSRTYWRVGNLAKATVLMSEALRNKEVTPSLITQLDQLTARSFYGELLLAEGNLTEARRELEQTISFREQQRAPLFSTQSIFDRPDRLLGQLEFIEGNVEKAREILERAWQERVKTLGPDNPETIVTAELLAEVLAAQGEYGRAEQLAIAAEQAGLKHLQMMMRALPEREAITYAERRPQGVGLLLSLAVAGNVKEIERVWQLALAGRGAVINGVLERQRALSGRQDTQVAQLQKAWREAAAVYARLLINGGKESQGLLTQAREAMEMAERRLTAVAPQSVEKAPPTLAAIQQALPANTALVSYVRYTPSTVTQRKLPDAYLAFVLTKTGAPQIVPLGPAAQVDARVQGWRDRAGRAPANAQADVETRHVGIALRKAVWDPLTVALKDRSQVLIVPDSQLLLVNFAALPVGDNQYLVEQAPLLHQLNDERELLLPTPHQRTGSLLALGGVDFNAGSESTHPDTFPFLEGTAQEIQEITQLWQKTAAKAPLALTGAAATKTAFEQQAANQRIVHLATHGFVWNTQLASARNANSRGISTVGSATWNTPTATVNSLHTAGLALAGANRNPEHGILTAAEVATLNLQSAEWVVLSACDTGLGNLAASEGMLGLRRAFRSAGAKSLVLSLWEADDAATREWMSALYRARLQQQQTTAQAVQTASRTVLTHRRAQHISTHPYYWATFIATGDWR